jgi:hypothetical protein
VTVLVEPPLVVTPFRSWSCFQRAMVERQAQNPASVYRKRCAIPKLGKCGQEPVTRWPPCGHRRHVLSRALLRWRSCWCGDLRVHPGRSDGSGEFVEGGCDAKLAAPGFEPEFIVAASQVLDEGMTCDDCPR